MSFLSPELESEISSALSRGKRNRYACAEENLIYRKKESEDILFSGSRNDINKILAIPYFNRSSDKTQVYSLISNDDITRRSLHVQLVSHIARSIGRGLLLNNDLIEAIALSHDIGHAPFGHLGERYIDRILFRRCGLHFSHNAQSVRVVDSIFPSNLSLQVLNAILCHCGKLFDDDGKISPVDSNLYGIDKSSEKFKKFDAILSSFSSNAGCNVSSFLVADTLEGIVVRVSDVIAYIGKDREDALKLGYDFKFTKKSYSKDLIKEFVRDIVENSYGKSFVAMSRKAIDYLFDIRKENFKKIYSSSDFYNINESVIFPLFEGLFDRFCIDLKKEDITSPVYKHHLRYLDMYRVQKSFDYRQPLYPEDKSDITLNLIVSDFISSMTDDYFIEVSKLYFPRFASHLHSAGYFEGLNPNKRKKLINPTPSLF